MLLSFLLESVFTWYSTCSEHPIKSMICKYFYRHWLVCRASFNVCTDLKISSKESCRLTKKSGDQGLSGAVDPHIDKASSLNNLKTNHTAHAHSVCHLQYPPPTPYLAVIWAIHTQSSLRLCRRNRTRKILDSKTYIRRHRPMSEVRSASWFKSYINFYIFIIFPDFALWPPPHVTHMNYVTWLYYLDRYMSLTSCAVVNALFERAVVTWSRSFLGGTCVLLWRGTPDLT